jgi:hypothetical protein
MEPPICISLLHVAYRRAPSLTCTGYCYYNSYNAPNYARLWWGGAWAGLVQCVVTTPVELVHPYLLLSLFVC